MQTRALCSTNRVDESVVFEAEPLKLQYKINVASGFVETPLKNDSICKTLYSTFTDSVNYDIQSQLCATV